LVIDPLPLVTKDYLILHQKEKQRLLHISSVPTEAATMVVHHPFSYYSDNKGRGRGH